MNKEELVKISKGLISEKEKIERELSEFKKDLGFNTDVEDNEEESEQAVEKENYLSIKKTQDSRLAQINRALEKITKGNYGICDKCGGQIEQKILDVDPESLYCKKCKMRM